MQYTDYVIFQLLLKNSVNKEMNFRLLLLLLL